MVVKTGPHSIPINAHSKHLNSPSMSVYCLSLLTSLFLACRTSALTCGRGRFSCLTVSSEFYYILSLKDLHNDEADRTCSHQIQLSQLVENCLWI